MKYYKFIVLVASLFSFSGSGFAAEQGFSSFSQEAKKATKALRCHKSKITPASYGFGALYGCIKGSAETVKFFINEIPNKNRVKSVKFIWNDWFKNMGYGIHADKRAARKALKVLISLYAPKKSKELGKVFWGSRSKTLKSKGYILKYTYSRGSEIDERMIVVTER